MSRRFTVQGTNQGFVCAHCGANVPALRQGGVRNHCHQCLHSLHVDVFPGDRANTCLGLLQPIGIEHSSKKGWVIVYRCQRCHEMGRNKAALDDPDAPDDFDVLVALSRLRGH